MLADAKASLASLAADHPGLPLAAVGFCWGGLYAALLAGGPAPAVSAAALLHPSLLTKADVDALAAPTLVVLNGNDGQVPDAFREEIRAALAARAPRLASDVLFFPDQEHGFTLRGDASDPGVAAAAQRAFEGAVGWLGEHASKA